ncbi:hypothetical protein OSTOST_23317, partial [Ostertagia ostertagi]
SFLLLWLPSFKATTQKQFKTDFEHSKNELALGKEQKPQLLAALVAAHFQLGNAQAVVQSALDFLPEIVKNGWWSLDPVIADGGAAVEANFWFIPCSAAGHWLSSIMLRTLRLLISETADDVLISTVLVLSQVDFASFGFAAFNEAMAVAENKESFKSIGIFEFLSSVPVLERISFMATEKPECFLPESGER